MKLSKLFENQLDIEIKNLTTDSRLSREGSLFFCIEGLTQDRHDFIDDAIGNGAVAIVHSKDVKKQEGVVYIKVDDVYKTLEHITDLYYDHPSQKMFVVGVTGTNGKSTITSTLRHVLNRLNSSTGYVGTISIEYDDVVEAPSLTTPDVIEMHDILNKMVQKDVQNVALEISSQGLDMRRVDTLDFDVAIFTNLSAEHMDYHKDLEDYFLAKKRLFDILKPEGSMILNVDDPYGKRLYDMDYSQKKISVSFEGNADYVVEDLILKETETRFTLVHKGVKYPVITNMLAKFNIYNLVQVIACVHEKGYPLDAIIPLVLDLPIVKGRVNMIDEGQDFKAIVDYSHTPDGFEKIYQYLRSITQGRLITVYGNAGGRDTTKRRVMGKISAQYCDYIVITEQDRRTEDVSQIKDMMVVDIKDTPFEFIEKRYEAIEYALNFAQKGDTVVVLGKGDERFQHGPDGKEPWMGDDEAVRTILKSQNLEMIK